MVQKRSIKEAFSPAQELGHALNGVITKIFEKGFGFISCPHFRSDVFFHLKDINVPFDAELRGVDVKFDVMKRKKGVFAVNVKIVNVISKDSKGKP
jgi:cold shock CspA family protein